MFFFSSRRRHTRLQGDWSSDVCSSDLTPRGELRGLERSDYAGDSLNVRRSVWKRESTNRDGFAHLTKPCSHLLPGIGWVPIHEEAGDPPPWGTKSVGSESDFLLGSTDLVHQLDTLA